MDPQSRIRSAELDYQARRGELIDRLTRAGHQPKITVILLGDQSAINYKVRLSCTQCGQTRRPWPLRLWSGLHPNRPCRHDPAT